MSTVIIISTFMGFMIGIWNGNLFSIGMFTICMVLLLPFYSWLYLVLDVKKDKIKITAVKCILTTLASVCDGLILSMIY